MGKGERTIKTVLSTVPFLPMEIEQLRKAFEPAEFISCASSDDQTIARTLERADVAVLEGDLDDRFVAAPHLEWIHCDLAGLDGSARADVFEKRLIVTSSSGRSAPALAQHGFYFALSLTYDARRLFLNQETRTWRGIDAHLDKLGLWGKTLGVVGFGHTGQEMAAIGKAFGMRVIVYRRSAEAIRDNVDTLLSADRGDDIAKLVTESDVIMLATQLTDDTYHLFDQDRFAQMKASAFIINLARGPVIDENALVHALQMGEIAGAGLDVFAQEPLPADSPLWDAPNVVITPHMTPRMPDRTQRSIDIIAQNVRRYRSGQVLLNAISVKDLYTRGASPTIEGRETGGPT